MRSDMFVYISGPMTPNPALGLTIEENTARGVNMHLELLSRGVPNFCPMLGGAFPSAWREVSHEVWLRYDKEVIKRCTHLLMLPGWETSRGANEEHRFAVELNLPIAYSLTDLDRMASALDVQANRTRPEQRSEP